MKIETKGKIVRFISKVLKYDYLATSILVERERVELVPIKKQIYFNKESLRIAEQSKKPIVQEMVDYILNNGLVKFKTTEIPTHSFENMQLQAEMLVARLNNR